MTYTSQDRFLLAVTIWAEARSTGYDGMRGVAHVITNRANTGDAKLFGAGLIGVIKRPKAFSCWNTNSPELQKMGAKYLSRLTPGTPDQRTWMEAQEIAGKVLDGTDPDPVKGALYYARDDVHPMWEKAMDKIASLGPHDFFI